MSGSEVKGIITSIIAAFSSGLDVLRRVREKRRVGKSFKHNIERQDPDELRLLTSMQKGPEVVRDEYEHGFARVGDTFAAGDVVAQASLAGTLLKLNTDLVNIISSFLCKGHDTTRLDYASLIDLSEGSRAEAINSLSQLYQRLSQSSVIPRAPKCGNGDCGCGLYGNSNASSALMAGAKRRQSEDAKLRAGNKVAAASKKRPKGSRQKQAGWVRQKGSSTSSVGLVKSRSNTPRTASRVNSQPALNSPHPPDSQQVSPPRRVAPKSQHSSSNKIQGDPKPLRPKQNKTVSQAPKPTASLSSSRSPGLSTPAAAVDTPPPAPAYLPHARIAKPRPATVLSFASASTKLGEIPERRWAIPPATQIDWKQPVVATEPVEAWPEARSKARLFGWFRRNRTAQAA
ncbi:MAG: hypothetical protein M1819_004864 [Sarea resinae]|nr:MAG: hypothetical protein M1819_004864 [Sarea resinae]